MRKIFWVLSLVFLSSILGAQQVSGYMSLKNLGGTTYQVTIFDYTTGNTEDTGACGSYDLDTIRINWGDGQSATINRSNRTGDSVCECRKLNIYVGTHTYAGPGNYHLSFDGGRRLANIENMTNSASQDMNIYYVIDVGAFTLPGFSPPVITNEPICSYGCTSQCYYFNLGASGGDSISYSLANNIAAGYYVPSGVTLNTATGELSWCNPTSVGLWEFAILVTTYTRSTIDSDTIEVPVDTEEVELQMTVQGTCPTGIPQIANKGGFTIYPNPSNGKFTIESTSDDSKSLVEVYDMLGEKIYTQTLNPNKDNTQLDLGSKASGIYLYRVLGENGEQISEGKFIIQK